MHHVRIASRAAQRVATAMGALIIAMTLAIALPGHAEASMSGCVWSQSTPISCVKLVGSGTWVESVSCGVNLAARQSSYGYCRVYGSGFSYTSGWGTYWNQSWTHRQTFWVKTVVIRRHLPSGSSVCGVWNDSRVGSRSPACGRISA